VEQLLKLQALRPQESPAMPVIQVTWLPKACRNGETAPCTEPGQIIFAARLSSEFCGPPLPRCPHLEFVRVPWSSFFQTSPRTEGTPHKL
jgi:hypothetical protein